MKSDLFICGALTLIPLFPTCVHAQGVSNGAAEGAEQGRADGGTVGAVTAGLSRVSTACSASINAPTFATRRPTASSLRHLPSGSARGQRRPEEDTRYYDVPSRYGVRG